MPVIEKLATEFDGRARVVKVEFDRGDDVLTAFDASGIPVYLLFRDGVEVDRVSGVIAVFLEARLRRALESALTP